MSIDFHRLMEPINNNRLIFIDYIDYIDCFPMINFHRLGRPGRVVEDCETLAGISRERKRYVL